MTYMANARKILLIMFILLGALSVNLAAMVAEDAEAADGAEVSPAWLSEWPDTDFSRHSINFEDIISGGPPKDGIPSIDEPRFKAISETRGIPDSEPVIVFTHNDETKVYPLRIMMWHEIVNDNIGGIPVVVTYCPLCNAAIVFDARMDGAPLTFGTTGKLRNSDLVMYDRQTESWWQQFTGDAIVGASTGSSLKMLPSRIEAFGLVRGRHKDALVLSPENQITRDYGSNPYVGYDTSVMPFLFQGDLPPNVNPMMRVVVVEGEAWTLPHLMAKGVIEHKDIVIRWEAGQNSALDTRTISRGRDVGNVIVQRKEGTGTGAPKDVVHHVTFAFVYYAFHPDGQLISE